MQSALSSHEQKKIRLRDRPKTPERNFYIWHMPLCFADGFPSLGTINSVFSFMERNLSIIYATFQRCPALRSSKFTISADPITSPAQPLHLSNLESLKLSAHHDFDWDQFIRPLTTPSLKTLEILSNPPPSVTPFLTLITRSNCSLDNFVLQDTTDQYTTPTLYYFYDEFHT